MKGQHPGEYCLMLEGPYLSVSEAEHALRDPFIEEWVEQTGRYRIHNLNEMMITPGVPLGQLGLEMVDERVFQLYSLDPKHPLTERKAEGVADALKRQDRKSTRLNSSHANISYAVFCLKKNYV